MNTTSRQHSWTSQVELFNRQNHGRPTRLGVFEPLNFGVNDYWQEDGLPLDRIDIEIQDETPMIEIVVGNFTHIVRDAKRIELHYSADGTDDGFDVIDARGRKSVLRFETDDWSA